MSSAVDPAVRAAPRNSGPPTLASRGGPAQMTVYAPLIKRPSTIPPCTKSS
ncbi:MAG: hypothetical protein ACK55I_50205 [bacterium]